MLVWGHLVAARLTLSCFVQLCLSYIMFWSHVAYTHALLSALFSNFLVSVCCNYDTKTKFSIIM